MMSAGTQNNHQRIELARGGAREVAAREGQLHDRLLNSEQAAAILQIHPKTLQKLARGKIICGIQVGKLWRFREYEIHRWIESQIAS